MKLLSIVVCFLCVNFLKASETYKAGVVLGQNKEINTYTPFIYEAGKTGVDILVLPSLESSESADNYDEAIKVISKAAKQAGLYVVTHLYEKTRCQLGYETIRSNLVFDRQGSIVAVKPQNGVANCTTSPSELVTFTTDFGVTFGVLMEEDIVLHEADYLKDLKNFVMTGSWLSEVPFLNAAQFSPSWSYVTNANLVSTAGIYSGKGGLKTGSEKLVIADLHSNGVNDHHAVPSVNPSAPNFSSEDLSQYVLRPLNLEASSKGYKDTICHGSFCCEFYMKTGDTGAQPDESYCLAAFDGVRHFSANHNIGAQVCALFSCTGNQRSCGSGSEISSSKISFERISIVANFTKQNAQYPIVQSTAEVPTENFKFETIRDGVSRQVLLEIVDSQNVVNLGIFGKDFETNFGFGERNNTEATNEFYDFIFNEDVQEFVDYVWIRLRVLIVVVSIYILEML